MNRKKMLIDILVIMIAFVLFIFYYESKVKTETITTSSLKDYKITLITMDKTSYYWTIVDRGASDMARMLGVTYKWEAPKTRIVDEQVDKIKNAIEEGADALLIAASDPVRVSGAIEDAKAAGIKIIYVDTPANEEGIITLTTNNYSAGYTAGETMISELQAIGIRAGSIGIVGVTRENTNTIDREHGFIDAIKEKSKYTILPTKYTDGSAELVIEVPTTFIAENTDMVGLFGTNEDTTVGVGKSIQNSNKKIIGIGFDLNITIQQMIKDGYLKAVMVQNPYTMGYLGMAEAVAALKGFDTGPSILNTGVSIQTEFTHIRFQ